jgi:hypothetical protein
VFRVLGSATFALTFPAGKIKKNNLIGMVDYQGHETSG